MSLLFQCRVNLCVLIYIFVSPHLILEICHFYQNNILQYSLNHSLLIWKYIILSFNEIDELQECNSVLLKIS
jgi:hypothetical protein